MDAEVEKCPEKSNLDAANVENSPEEWDLKTMAAATGQTGKSHSLPCFLQRVIGREIDEIKGYLGFLIVAVHAVFLESGFVVCSKNVSRLLEGWAFETSRFSIQYTIPCLLDGWIEERDVKVATLKFSAMGDYVLIYGCVCGDRPAVYRLCLNVSNVLPSLVSALNSVGGREEEERFFNLWKIVKDGLSLPLLIDICEKNGLPPPPCFACLPIDLKITILELLHGVDVARVCCTGSELRYLASNDKIWKQKFEEEFEWANEIVVAVGITWKERFKRLWFNREVPNSRGCGLGPWYPSIPPQGFPMIDGPDLLFPPSIPQMFNQMFPMIHGDYDRLPVIGDGPGPIGPGSGFLHW